MKRLYLAAAALVSAWTPSPESYALSYSSGTLTAPFNSQTYGTTAFLSSVTATGLNISRGFTYDSHGAGELAQVTTPLATRGRSPFGPIARL